MFFEHFLLRRQNTCTSIACTEYFGFCFQSVGWHAWPGASVLVAGRAWEHGRKRWRVSGIRPVWAWITAAATSRSVLVRIIVFRRTRASYLSSRGRSIFQSVCFRRRPDQPPVSRCFLYHPHRAWHDPSQVPVGAAEKGVHELTVSYPGDLTELK